MTQEEIERAVDIAWESNGDKICLHIATNIIKQAEERETT